MGVLVVLAAQYFVPQKEHSTHGVAPGEVERTETQSARSLSSTSVVVAANFESVFNHQSPAEQYKMLYNTFSQSTEQELKEWWTHSQNIERASHREIAQQVILRNLTSINPQAALRSLDDASMLQRDALLTTIFAEWAEIHLNDAINAVSKLVGPQRTVALEAMLKSRDDLSENELRTIAVQLEQEDTYLRFISEVKALQSITDPSESLDILLNDNVNDSLQMGTLTIVAETWREQIGFEVLSKIYHSKIKDYWIKRDLTSTIARESPALALEYAKGLAEEYERSYLSHISVKEWARTNPLAALAATTAIEPSSLVADLQEEIADIWAKTKPYEMIGNIELISKESRVAPLVLAFSYIAREDPLGAIESLGAIEHSVEDTSPILRRIVDEWGQLQPEAATDWVLNHTDQDDPKLMQSLLQEVLPSLARQDPIKAFEIALEHPVPTFGSGLEVWVLNQLTRDGNNELAISLLPRVRDKSQTEAYRSIAWAMVKEGQTFEALELGRDLATQQQRYYYDDVIQAWAGTDPTSLYASLEDLPSSASQTQAVSELFFHNQMNPVLTDEQLEQAKSLLDPDDAARVQRGWIKVERSIP